MDGTLLYFSQDKRTSQSFCSQKVSTLKVIHHGVRISYLISLVPLFSYIKVREQIITYNNIGRFVVAAIVEPIQAEGGNFLIHIS